MHEEFLRSDVPLGVLWVTVDQAQRLRQTHGARACEAMLEKVERTLAQRLEARPRRLGAGATMSFWCCRTNAIRRMLAAHAQTLAGLARTTDFRWWGDRISLTREHWRGAG